MLSGKTGIKNPDAPVNLVSRYYLISLITRVIRGDMLDPVIHAVSEPQITRESYCTQQAKALELTSPEFEKGDTQVGKYVSSICF